MEASVKARGIQDQVKFLTKVWQQGRMDKMPTIGSVLEDLKKNAEAHGDNLKVTMVDGTPIGDFHSYRGYYEDLACGAQTEVLSLKEFIAKLEACIDKTFTGYKGGEFLMSSSTPFWISDYGDASGYSVEKYLPCGEHLHIYVKNYQEEL